MLMCARAACGSSSVQRATGEEDQAELADLHLVPAVQRDLLDPLTVDVGAVQAADVADGEHPAAVPAELHVPAGDGDVVEEDVALRMAARRW